MEAIRSSLGLCPQHNVLFDDLTVAEHIWFYSRLKHGNNDVETEAEKLIMDLDLPHKRHQKVDCLSGGMKRRPVLAIIFQLHKMNFISFHLRHEMIFYMKI